VAKESGAYQIEPWSFEDGWLTNCTPERFPQWFKAAEILGVKITLKPACECGGKPMLRDGYKSICLDLTDEDTVIFHKTSNSLRTIWRIRDLLMELGMPKKDWAPSEELRQAEARLGNRKLTL
jgi:Fe-S oxidoreductase